MTLQLKNQPTILLQKLRNHCLRLNIKASKAVFESREVNITMAVINVPVLFRNLVRSALEVKMVGCDVAVAERKRDEFQLPNHCLGINIKGSKTTFERREVKITPVIIDVSALLPDLVPGAQEAKRVGYDVAAVERDELMNH